MLQRGRHRHGLHVIAVGICLIAMTLLAGGTRAQNVSEARRILNLYDALALGGAEADGKVYRWKRPVRVRVVGSPSGLYRRWASNVVSGLADATGHSLQMSEVLSAEILLLFVPSMSAVLDGQHNTLLDRYFQDHDARDRLFGQFRQDRAVCGGKLNAIGNELVEAVVLVPEDRLPPVVHACLSAQLARAMGLPHKSDADANSVMAERSPHSHLTGDDKMVLSLLYHPRMMAGLSRQEALTIAESIMPDLRPVPAPE